MANDRSDTPMTITGSTSIIGTITFTGSSTIINSISSPVPITTYLVSTGTNTITATTAGTTILIPSTATNSIYVRNIIVGNGAAQGSVLFGYGVGVVAPTTTAIVINSIYLGANTPFSSAHPLEIKIPASNNFLITAVSCTTLSISASYYVAP